MVFDVSMIKMINIIIICIGIGVSGLCFMQVWINKTLREDVRKFFMVFFNFVIVYITMHLLRDLMDGQTFKGVRFWQSTVTVIELVVAAFMAASISRLIIFIALPEDKQRTLSNLLSGLLIFHILLLTIDQFIHVIYYFDYYNYYQRGSLYILSNLAPAFMHVMDIILLLRHQDKFKPSVKPAFWVYIISPAVAIILQSLTYGIQFVIFATVASSVYMFYIIILDQSIEYVRQQGEKSRIETELNMASNIQNNMLPNIYPAFPDIKQIDIYASMTPAKEVGGDFYDFFLIDDTHLGIVMADVSGKGVPAALFMMVSKMLVKNNAMNNMSPKEVLEAVNKQICSNNREGMFVTVWLGILDLETGVLKAVNAGHEYPALKRPGRPFKLIKDKHGIVVGVIEGVRYTEYELTLDPGSKIFVYTDGVAEATNENEELFGTDRMIEALNANPDLDPKSMLESINKKVSEFVGNAPQFDDLTMLCLEFKERL
ncbi:MAG: PP2C family protein-serine/threonine phosphatase [Saccharofermentans sp.]|nr:PP2C family protein-serine/threonine phosphatase [Saccharofermentans sp.]